MSDSCNAAHALTYQDELGVPEKFTGKERDTETGFDYFGARYFSGDQGRFTGADPMFITEQRLVDPQQWNLYSYTRNNPLKYVDPDGMDVTFADAKLKTQFMNIAAESSTLMGEYNAAESDRSMNVQVVERGLRQNEQGSQGDTTVSSTDQNGVTKVVIYIDPYRSSDDTIVHEWGHEKDAREMGGTAFVHEAQSEQSHFSDKGQHNQRPVEQSADKFKDQVNKERKAYKKAVSEQKKAAQKAEKERKKKK